MQEVDKITEKEFRAFMDSLVYNREANLSDLESLNPEKILIIVKNYTLLKNRFGGINK